MTDKLPTSSAQPARVLFVLESIPNKSVHFSLDLKSGENLNFRIPAIQLQSVIACLQRVNDNLVNEGISTGDNSILIPSPFYGFWEQ